ncbi:cation diffusion facilitator family transporter containing protein, putative [Ichthyophthirius multifiliis]|uniref:Cation diffusion facilitator family transporter containing protein, putative n=1 Tax=Ichthyophthirius multifiliis TaxID=5932 RepID=G0QZV5_ICHMU|nr:cation diffusion facilitator family transporter containing protein, putative [Ichthyophthirius multifiliis]EGR29250.1 cation diffusion facilitator family transporter containing protein, putative [Ichthyophthirius multifiliis]|eukprot:XP_004030486.1 cation diffusion facilitator family transporter containing protein, putative [Ichthyophthirius multifiliis]
MNIKIKNNEEYENKQKKIHHSSIIRKFIKYMKLSQQSEESQRLSYFIIQYLILITFSIIVGITYKDITLSICGIYTLMHIFSYSFSLYALIKAKHNQNTHYTYGYTRYETISAFSTCIFLIIQSFFNIMSSFHLHSEEQEDHKGYEDEENQSKKIFLYAKIGINIIGIICFWDYKYFSLNKNLDDICIETNKYAYQGLKEKQFQIFSLQFKNFQKYFNNNQEESQLKMLEKSEFLDKLQFMSSFENLHSVFLHFYIDFLFDCQQILSIMIRNFYFRNSIPFLVMLFVIIFTYEFTYSLLRVLLQASPIQDEKGVKNLSKQISSLSGVSYIANQRIWGMTAGYLVYYVNVIAKKNCDFNCLHDQIQCILKKKFYSYCIQIDLSENE